MTLIQALGLTLTLACLARGNNYADLIADLQYLYKIDQMGDNGLPFTEYYPEDSYDNKMEDDWNLAYPDTIEEPAPKVSRDYGEAALRDQEYMKQLPISGYHFISGGTGREEDPSEVKTDKVLPAYCTPPNPCPHGYTGTDNCVKDFENSPDNNRRILEQQDCPCDAEHMLSCPPGKKTIDPKSGLVNTESLENIDLSGMDDLNNVDLSGNPYLSSGTKRQKLVAKKSPNFIKKRSTDDQYANIASEMKERLDDINPYFNGQPKRVAAKKQAPRRNM